MSKKIQFGTAPAGGSTASALDDLVRSRREPDPEPPQSSAGKDKNQPDEPTKRISADLPVKVHQKLKIHCAQHNILIADFLRDLVMAQFADES